ncbi:hypothetical protein COSO111634_17815 [Corallococcus soli]
MRWASSTTGGVSTGGSPPRRQRSLPSSNVRQTTSPTTVPAMTPPAASTGATATSRPRETRHTGRPSRSRRSTVPASLPSSTPSATAVSPVREEASLENWNAGSTGARWQAMTASVNVRQGNQGRRGQARDDMVWGRMTQARNFDHALDS